MALWFRLKLGHIDPTISPYGLLDHARFGGRGVDGHQEDHGSHAGLVSRLPDGFQPGHIIRRFAKFSSKSTTTAEVSPSSRSIGLKHLAGNP